MGLRRKPPIRRDGERIRIALDDDERALLQRLSGEMAELLAQPDDHPALVRLFPTAYPDDPEAETFYRLMARDELAERHRTAMAALTEAMSAETLDPGQAESLMRAINQMRLVVGTQLGIASDDDDMLPDRDDPMAPMASLYHWLGWLLELTIEALSEG